MKTNLLSLVLVVFFSTISWAGNSSPACMAGRNQVLPVNNDQVLQWKQSSRNQFKSRGHIQGRLLKIYPNQNGHIHISVQIGRNNNETVEVVYNENFGRVKSLQEGATVEACGDYITSNSPTGRYDSSPDGAIVHWVHASNNNRHESGYMIIDGNVYGGVN